MTHLVGSPNQSYCVIRGWEQYMWIKKILIKLGFRGRLHKERNRLIMVWMHEQGIGA